ncbi:MAG: hypothetical protein EPN82_06215 [Bacteroidetes bacterium]|nr:MAG: hypothetical protein EPN82_06215 [Bacteroidota bacterium]
MKLLKLIFILFCFCNTLLNAKETISIPLTNAGDSCFTEPRIFFVDVDKNNVWDILFYKGCNSKSLAYSLLVQSFVEININQTAYLTDGTIETKNFIILIYDSGTYKYTHKLFFDPQISKAILEDYTDNGSDLTSYEEADNYFYTQQMGTILLITKKAEIDVQSVLLCSLDGRIITNLQNIGGWSQFSFDMSLEPSGIYCFAS